ncbi:Spastin [Arachis hypogaea]|nr:Spastin [Arachis hypogaea]
MNGGQGDRGASEFLLTSQSDDLIQIEIIGCTKEPAEKLSRPIGSNFAYDSWQDNFGRLHDRSKEIPKVMKQFGRLFPNRMTIQLPQDETLFSDWKQQLERDVEIMKAQSNVVSIRMPCKGILLFGSLGTGKFMLAKAVSIEAGANFINISMSGITSKEVRVDSYGDGVGDFDWFS